MPKGKCIEKPSVKDTFFLGSVVSCLPGGSISYIKSRKRYSFRFKLVFQSGVSKSIQRSGFPTRKAAQLARDDALIQICRKQFVPYSCTVKEFYDYWLWYYMWDEKDISYNTYMTYRNIILNYIDPALGTISLPSLKRKDLIQVLLGIPSPNVRRLACAVVSSSMQVARDRNYISCNIAMKITAEVNRLKRTEEQRLMSTPAARKQTAKVYSSAQLSRLQNVCRQEEPSLYLPMLLAAATGLRVSELRALKYDNIDFLNKCASIETQLGRTKDADPDKNYHSMQFQEKKLKTINSRRKIVLPDYVLTEILLERQRYEHNRATEPDFCDLGYVCCRKNGLPYGQNFYKKPYQRLLKKYNFPKIDWRKLRNSNATILANEKVSMKAISKNLGHSSPDFTNTVYVEHQPLVYDLSRQMEEYVLLHGLLPESPAKRSSKVNAFPDDSAYMKYFSDKI